MVCFCVSSSTDNVMSIGDTIYELHWYQLPCNDQLTIKMIIERAQTPYQVKGLGILACSLDTYLKVRGQSFDSNAFICSDYHLSFIDLFLHFS